MKTLYHAVITLHVSEYLGRSYDKEVIRLVWGADEDEAQTLIEKKYDTGNSYSTSYTVTKIVLTEALGSPIESK